MNCANCGKKIKNTSAKFCNKCGYKIDYRAEELKYIDLEEDDATVDETLAEEAIEEEDSAQEETLTGEEVSTEEETSTADGTLSADETLSEEVSDDDTIEDDEADDDEESDYDEETDESETDEENDENEAEESDDLNEDEESDESEEPVESDIDEEDKIDKEEENDDDDVETSDETEAAAEEQSEEAGTNSEENTTDDEKSADKSEADNDEKKAEESEDTDFVIEELDDKKKGAVNKARGKKILIISLIAFFAIVLLALLIYVVIQLTDVSVIEARRNAVAQAAENINETTTEQDAEAVASEVSEGDVTDVNSELEEAEEVEEVEKVREPVTEDPLASNENVIFLGEKGRKDQETWDIVAALIEDENIAESNILSVACSDYDNDGSCEAFIFVGEKITEEIEDEEADDSQEEAGDETDEDVEEIPCTYTGNVWFSDGKNHSDLGASKSDIWGIIDGYYDFGGRKYYMAEENYTTNKYSRLWSVYDGTVTEEAISGLGQLDELADGSYTITVDNYDCIYDYDNNILLGHSWKNYYFYYDKAADMFKEYGGIEVNPNDLNELCGENVLAKIDKANSYFLDAYLRDNGILNINYITYSSRVRCAEFHTATYDTVNQIYLEAFTKEEGSFEKSDEGGQYYAALVPDIAEFPNKKSYESTVFITVSSLSDVFVISDRVFIMGMDADERNNCKRRAFIIDSSTEGMHGEDSDNMTSLEWMKWLAQPDEEMQENGDVVLGVFELAVNGSHVDNIKDHFLYE